MQFAQGVFTNFKNLLDQSSKQKSAKSIVVVLLMYALEQIISTKTFYSCPADGYRIYGGLFLFAPGACFFVLSLLLNNKFLVSLTGCYRGDLDNTLKVLKSTAKALRRSTFIAFVWFVLAFANTQFYVCFRLGPEPSNMTPEKQETIQRKFGDARSRSTVISWTMFLSAIVFALLYITIRRCFVSDTEGTLPSYRNYEKLESHAAVAKFKEKMVKIAKKEGEEQVELRFKMAQEEGKKMYIAVRETKEWLQMKYPRTTGDLTKEYRVENVKENWRLQNHDYQSVNTDSVAVYELDGNGPSPSD